MLEAGKLDRRVDILAVTTGADDMGGVTHATSVVATVWAEKHDLRGREFYAANADNAEIETRFRIRYRDDVTAENLISYDGREFEIVSVAEIGRREGLEIMARARAEA